MPNVSVLDYGADPTGYTNSTGAFTNAQIAANGGIIKIPRGDYRIDPETFWVGHWEGENTTTYTHNPKQSPPKTSAAFLPPLPNWVYQNPQPGFCPLVPHKPPEPDDLPSSTVDKSKSIYCSRILPTKPGKWLVGIYGQTFVENVLIDCAAIIEHGIYAAGAHTSSLTATTVTNSKDFGYVFQNSGINAYRILASYCQKGISIQGCNGSFFDSPNVSNGRETGIEVVGGIVIDLRTSKPFANDKGEPTIYSGKATILNGKVDGCASTFFGFLVHIRGVSGGRHDFSYLEAGGDAAIKDPEHKAIYSASGIWLTENDHLEYPGHMTITSNLSLSGSFTGTAKGVFMRLRHTQLCNISGSNCGQGNDGCNKIEMDAESVFGNEFFGLHQNTQTDLDPLKQSTALKWITADGNSFTAFEREGRLQAEDFPRIGRWGQGQIIENWKSSVGSPSGWVCLKANYSKLSFPWASIATDWGLTCVVKKTGETGSGRPRKVKNIPLFEIEVLPLPFEPLTLNRKLEMPRLKDSSNVKRVRKPRGRPE